MRARLTACLLLAACAPAATGCAGSGNGIDGRPEADARLMLQDRPSAVDAGLYLARQRDYGQTEGVNLQVETPVGPLTGIRALVAGQTDLAIVDIHDLARARARGQDLVAVQAIVETPLAAPLARAVARARQRGTLRGRIGGPNSVPPHPELVLAVTRETLETSAPVVAAAIRTLRRGYEATIDDPESGVSAVLDAAPALKRSEVAAQLSALSPSFVGGERRFGELSAGPLETWARWEQHTGLIARRPDVAAMFDPALSRTGEQTDPN
jgi:ABC-type nitrate/sulfonate/bicarbonate transport system substrate-binding protein